jgi:hypothetical protein
MLTITDAASETMIRLDMTNPFLRLVTKLSLGARSAGSAGKIWRPTAVRTFLGGPEGQCRTSGFAVPRVNALGAPKVQKPRWANRAARPDSFQEPTLTPLSPPAKPAPAGSAESCRGLR